VKKVGKYYVCEICGFFRDENETKVRKHESLHKETEPIVRYGIEMKSMSAEARGLSKGVSGLRSFTSSIAQKLQELEIRLSKLEKEVSELTKPSASRSTRRSR